jgi:aryl-alcohol dehydrogenase-like predicted oxidoreductase
MRSVEGSLRRLNTEAIDLLWVHMWDFTTPVEEVMRGLDDLVRMGKVHYLGISDTPAWVVAQANTLADQRGWTPFVALQVEYSLLQRTPERDLLPMSRAFKLGLTPWSPLAGGALTGKYLRNESGRVKEESERRSARANRIAEQVVATAEAIGASPAQVAIRWTMDQHPNSVPIIGARKLPQIEDCLGAPAIDIPETYRRQLDEVSAVDLGFPHDFLQQEGVQKVLYADAADQLHWPDW